MKFDAIQQPQITVLQDPVRGIASNTAIQTWQLGQVLNATVASASRPDGLTQLSIGGVQLTAQTDTSLTAAETLNLKVVQLPTLPLVKALTVPVQQLSQSQSLLLMNTPEAIVKDWQVGQVLRATTLEQSATGETLLNIAGRLLSADTSRALIQGQTLMLRVLNLTNPLLLQIQELTENKAGAKEATATLQLPTVSQAAISPSLRLVLPIALQQQLRPGDTLESQVREVPQQGKAVLIINGRAVTALTTLPLTEGQQLKLQVADLGKPPVLVPVTGRSHVEDIINQQLRALLPQQTGLPELLSSLAAIGTTNPHTQSLLQRLPTDVGKELRALAQQILQQLPRLPVTGSAQGVKQALQQSGVLLEHQLADSITQQLPFPSGDLKANLLRLLSMLQRQLAALPAPPTKNDTTTQQTNTPRSPAPPLRDAAPQAQAQAKTDATLLAHNNSQRILGELMRQVGGSLARIQLHQLASLSRDHDVARVLSTEFPLQHGQGADVFHVRIDEHVPHSTTQYRKKTWSITLAFELAELGPIHVKLTLGADIINTTFWVAHTSTKEAIDSQLGLLQQNMVKAGLKIGQMTCHQGQPPQLIADPTRPSFIVDVQV